MITLPSDELLLKYAAGTLDPALRLLIERHIALHPATAGRLAAFEGFGGLLLSDDLCMNALSGTLTQRAEASLKAGCDLVIHGTGDMAEMRLVAEGVGKLKGGAARRAEAALARIVHTPEPLDLDEARARFSALLSGRLDAAKGPDVGEAQA